MRLCRWIQPCLVVLVLACGVAPAAGTSYPLELTNIRPGLSRDHRIARAYPGIEYNIRAAVIGGVYPYTFALRNAPPGMTIDPRRGEISWPDPRATASPTIVVVDAEGAEVTATWTIGVTTEGFRFIDAVNGRNAAGDGCDTDCGSGTPAKPWRTIRDMYRNGRPGDFVYFRTGMYRVTDLPRVRPGSPWERVEFAEQKHPVVWLAQPGHSPAIDFGHKPGVEAAPLIRMSGTGVYVDGFETVNSRLIAFQFVSGTGAGPTFRRLRMHAHGPGIDGSNAAFILTTTSPEPSDYGVIQDCEFWDVTGASVTIKVYAQRKLLIEDTIHHHAPLAIELKDDVRQFTVRGNTFHDVSSTAIGGNMHEPTTHGEILFNNVRAGVALDLNQDGMAGPIHVYRNTLIGTVQVRNADADDGPFFLTRNVIVSGERGYRGSRVELLAGVSEPKRVVLAENIGGSPSAGLVDKAGHLQGKYLRYLGTHGHQLAESGRGAPLRTPPVRERTTPQPPRPQAGSARPAA